MQSVVGYYNPDEPLEDDVTGTTQGDRLRIVSALQAACDQLGLPQPQKYGARLARQGLGTFAVIVTHHEPYAGFLRDLADPTVPVRDGLVVIRVSKVPRPEGNVAVDNAEGSAASRYLLVVSDTRTGGLDGGCSQDADERWTDFLGAVLTDGVVAAFLKGKDHEDQAALDLLQELCGKRRVRVLAALAILCQGYLAVHADPNTGQADSLDEQSTRAVQHALGRMGWSEAWLRKGRTLLPPEVLDTLEREKLRRRVAGSEWWSKPLAGVDVVEESRREWGRYEPEGWHAVDKLVTAVAGRLPVEPETVARAYDALSDRLK